MQRLLLRGFAILALVVSGAAPAQTWPTKPVRLILGFAVGGSTDVMARMLAAKLTERVGQQVLVENRPGASSNIASEYVARATPDGHTLLNTTSTMTVNATLFPKLPFNVIEDFVAVTPTVAVPSILSLHPSVQARTLKEFIDLAKARPGSISYGSAGEGSAAHLATELFQGATGVSMVHVPYKGAGPAMTDLLAGHIQVLFIFSAQQVNTHAAAGKLRPLGVTSLQRMASRPDLPTLQELGLEGFEAISWSGLLAPRGTPRDIVSRINQQSNAATRELTKQLGDLGAYAVHSTPEQFAAYVKAEIAKWSIIVKRAGIKPES